MLIEQDLRQRIYSTYLTSIRDKDKSSVKSELQIAHLDTKVKLLEEALTKRNKEFEGLDENNKQLIYLLEKYDNKLSEVQDELDYKEVKLKELEEEGIDDRDQRLNLQTIEDRISYLRDLLDRYEEQKKKKIENNDEDDDK